MELKIANSDNHEDLLEYYVSKEIEELRKIQPLWAFGENVHHIQDYSQHPENGSYDILIVDVTQLIKRIEFINFDIEILFTGDLASDCRLATTLYRWENLQFVDPPTISIDDNRITILDGRHRLKLAFQLGCSTIPIAIHKSLVDSVMKIIDLKTI
jgi:hypothetical protein